MKNFIRKVSAVGTGFALLGMSIGGAVAADLADLPEPFVVSDSYVGTAMVIGSTEDSAARSTLKTYFDGFATEVAAGLGDLIETQEVKLQDSIASSTALETSYEDSDSDIFIDETVTIGGTSYNMHTELQLSNTAADLDVETSLTSNQDKYALDPKLEIKTDAIKYCYVFDEHINVSGVVSSTSPMDMDFMDKTIRITAATNTSITAEVGDSWAGHPGEIYTGNGITMEVITVDGDSAIVDFGNDQRPFSAEGTTISIGEVDVYLDTATAGVGSIDEAVATFIIGPDAVKTYSDGDAYSDWCSPVDGHGYSECDEDTPDWVWDIKELNTGSATTGFTGSTNEICIENDFQAYNYNSNPAGVGEYFGLPTGFAYVGIDSLTVSDDNYMELTVAYEDSVDLNNEDTFGPDSGRVIHLSVNKDEGMKLDFSEFNLTDAEFTGDTDTTDIYLWTNSSYADAVENGENKTIQAWYKDGSNKIQFAGNLTVNDDGSNTSQRWQFGNMNWGSTKGTDITLNLYGNLSQDDSLFLGLMPSTALSSNDNLWFRLQTKVDDTDTSNQGIFLGFGDTDNDESDEVIWGRETSPRLTPNTTSNENLHVGGKTYDLLTGYGLQISETDSAGDSDSFTIMIPDDQVYANVAVYEGGGAASSSEVDLVTASEDLAGYTNLVLVGGPAVNSATADFLDLTFPAYGDASGIALDTAVVKFVEKDGQMALIVAGWEKADTQRAASEVASEGLAGESMVV